MQKWLLGSVFSKFEPSQPPGTLLSRCLFSLRVHRLNKMCSAKSMFYPLQSHFHSAVLTCVILSRLFNSFVLQSSHLTKMGESNGYPPHRVVEAINELTPIMCSCGQLQLWLLRLHLLALIMLLFSVFYDALTYGLLLILERLLLLELGNYQRQQTNQSTAHPCELPP